MAQSGGRPGEGQGKDLHPGMMGDETEEQNLGQEGDPKARITREEVEKAFGGEGGKDKPGQDQKR